mmetsp:Transcript_10330/g.25327  ORF Transcript_10330/g.25327 Transcript_10330/m.25327 type:complete len:220 (-) Transcript_10330:1054-1713(-)
MSSILRIMRTHSVARDSALVDTSSGCTTLSSNMSLMVPLRTLMPKLGLPSSACLLRSSVTISMGLSPAFSASVYGITSSASANALTHTASMPLSVRAHLPSCWLTSTSGAPPPTMRKRFCTRQRMTHSASCSERSASAHTSLLLPRHSTVTVLPMSLMPVIFTILSAPHCTSFTSSAWPSLSGVSWSTCATGMHFRVLLMNSTSSRSTSRTTRILALAR